jgi:hypothetical protein
MTLGSSQEFDLCPAARPWICLGKDIWLVVNKWLVNGCMIYMVSKWFINGWLTYGTPHYHGINDW